MQGNWLKSLSVSEWRADNGPLLRQLAATIAVDGQAGLNAALTHGILFQAWVEHVRQDEDHRNRCVDMRRGNGLSQHSRLRINTGAAHEHSTSCSDGSRAEIQLRSSASV